ncbi:hypothetical protein CKAH01_05075 [Colletotrichum kahawae]|uniref:Uncharacterized protein n=1 Tax=Colletotrichum kahawae TaxID=34407 RepID=A0AAD9YEN5_COLKA|nr:hypothetical protein CKAH01_05075 [Colletotrichum kahawae]
MVWLPGWRGEEGSLQDRRDYVECLAEERRGPDGCWDPTAPGSTFCREERLRFRERIGGLEKGKKKKRREEQDEAIFVCVRVTARRGRGRGREERVARLGPCKEKRSDVGVGGENRLEVEDGIGVDVGEDPLRMTEPPLSVVCEKERAADMEETWAGGGEGDWDVDVDVDVDVGEDQQREGEKETESQGEGYGYGTA